MINNIKDITSELVKLGKKYSTAIGYEKLTVTGVTAQSLTIPDETTYCEIRVESADTSSIVMRYLLTGAAPTTANGMALVYLDFFDITGPENIRNFKVIATSGSHTLHIQYYK